MSQQTPVLQLENFVPCVQSTNMISTLESNFAENAEILAPEVVDSHLPSTNIMSTTESNFAKTAEELASENGETQLPALKKLSSVDSNFAKTAEEQASANGDPQLTSLVLPQSLSQPIFSQTPAFSTSAHLLRGVTEILPTPPATPRANTQAVNGSFDYQFILPTSTPLNPSTSLPQLTDSMIGDFIATPSELTMNAITSTQFRFQPAPESNPVQQVLSEVRRKRKNSCQNEEENDELARASKRQKVNAESFVRSINVAYVQNRAFPADACEDLMGDLVEQFEFSSRLSFTDRKTLHNLIIVYLMEFAEPRCSTAELETFTVNLFAQTIPELQAKADTRGTVTLTCANTRTPGGFRWVENCSKLVAWNISVKEKVFT